ncbi:MAG: 4a-hydroxytetrahydrobiopterin dehydratase [Geodermatophilaceae bacterium]|nr:4a-hydroxytetrahydrobiopterin dehydratase [Geodermatophilaceae bacterium]
MPAVLDHDAVTAALAHLPDWRAFDDSLHARFDAPDFPTAIRLVDRVAAAAEHRNHHPDIDIRWKKVAFTLSTHSAGGVTEYDLTLAEHISAVASELGAAPTAAALQKTEIAIDCMDPDAIREFWRVGLDLQGSKSGDGALVDPSGAVPAVWFQKMSEPRPDRNRLHIDVYLPRGQAEDRVEALLAAGGRRVNDQHAPSWWVMADAEGNELCVCV